MSATNAIAASTSNAGHGSGGPAAVVPRPAGRSMVAEAMLRILPGSRAAARLSAAIWPERLFHKVVWRLTDTLWVYVIHDPARAGNSLFTLMLDELDTFLRPTRRLRPPHSRAMFDFASEIWDRATTAQPVPSATVVLLTGLVAVALVLARPTWLRVRLGITVVHEGGHAVVAVLTGRRLQGIRVHSDTSGLMTSRGKPRAPGMIATLMAGYLAPTALGLLAATLVGAGYAVGLLWLAVALMTVMLFWMRNAYGFLALGSGIVIAGAISWYAGASTQSAVAYLLVWLLLFAAPRPGVGLLAAG